MVNHAERGDPQSMQVAAPWGRSAWEDILQQRRQLMAGKGGGQVLDKRPDDDRPKLLSPEEENKLRQQQKQRENFRSRSQFRKVVHGNFPQIGCWGHTIAKMMRMGG